MTIQQSFSASIFIRYMSVDGGTRNSENIGANTRVRLLWERQFEEVLTDLDGRMWMTSKWLERSRMWLHMEKDDDKF